MSSPALAFTDVPPRLPEEKPASVSDLDRIVYARGKNRRTAHISTGNATPLCVRADAFDTDWKEDPTDLYPDPDDWFNLCGRCLARYEQLTGLE